jgi:glycosyltransferase involved in cell wall biosynthesis
MGRKVILHSHASRVKVWYEGLSERHQRRVGRMLSKLDRLIVLSSSWRDFFVSIGVSPEKVDIVNNITEPAGREKVAREAGGPVQLLFLGEIGPRKGVFDLLQAMALLQGAAPGKARLEIGGNKNEEALEEAIRSQELADCVHFNGFVAGDRKKELLNRAEVFVLPSYHEGLPVSILEAMSYGCAIISTPVGGIPEVVRENGILVRPGDVEGIAAAIARCADESVCRRMGLSSLEIVKDYYPEAVMVRLKQIYESLLR